MERRKKRFVEFWKVFYSSSATLYIQNLFADWKRIPHHTFNITIETCTIIECMSEHVNSEPSEPQPISKSEMSMRKHQVKNSENLSKHKP